MMQHGEPCSQLYSTRKLMFIGVGQTSSCFLLTSTVRICHHIRNDYCDASDFWLDIEKGIPVKGMGIEKEIKAVLHLGRTFCEGGHVIRI